MYWPSTDAIEDSVSACKPCLTFSSKQQREPYVSDTATQPWSNLSLDNFESQGQHFIMILDISTKFFVVRPVSSLGTDCTIQTPTSVFSEQDCLQTLDATKVEILFQMYSISTARI